MAKPNPFVKKAEEEEARRQGEEAAQRALAAAKAEAKKPKRRKTAKEKADEKYVSEFCEKISSGELDDHLLTVAESLDARREVMKEKVAAAVRAVYGEDYVVTKPGSSPTPLQGSPVGTAGAPQDTLTEGGKHPNEVDLTGFAAEGLPDLSAGYGQPSIMEGGGAVSAAVDVLGGGDGEGDIVSTGWQGG